MEQIQCASRLPAGLKDPSESSVERLQLLVYVSRCPSKGQLTFASDLDEAINTIFRLLCIALALPLTLSAFVPFTPGVWQLTRPSRSSLYALHIHIDLVWLNIKLLAHDTALQIFLGTKCSSHALDTICFYLCDSFCQ